MELRVSRSKVLPSLSLLAVAENGPYPFDNCYRLLYDVLKDLGLGKAVDFAECMKIGACFARFGFFVV